MSKWRELPLQPSGVYALVWHGKVVYIGQSTNLFHRISDHRNKLSRARRGLLIHSSHGPTIQFDRVFVQLCGEEELNRLEYQLINLYKPACNIALREDRGMVTGPKIDFKLEDLGIKRWKTQQASPNYLRR